MVRKILLLWCGIFAVDAAMLYAQTAPPTQSDPAFDAFPGLNDPLGSPGAGQFGPRVEFSGFFQVERGGREGTLLISATIVPGWHIYSMTQPDGGPRRTEIAVTTAPDFQVVGDFEADRDPMFHPDPAFPGLPIEEFSDEVTWQAPIRLSDGVDPASVQIHVTIDGQVCETGGSCDLINGESVRAQFAGYTQARATTSSYKDPGGHVTIIGHVEPKVAAPGDTVKLVLTANLQPSWHVYRLARTDPKKVSKPTLIALRKVAGWGYGDAEASVQPKQEESGLEDEPILYYHEGTVSWTVPVYVPKSVAPGEYSIAGGIAYQVCTPSSCDRPSAANFEVPVAISTQTVKGQVPLAFAAGAYDEVAKAAVKQAERQKQRQATAKTAKKSKLDSMPLVSVLGIAFLAGLILNVMPCVLPVIGLKIMSFVHQAGGSRSEILALNLWFSLGLMSVFWILGGAAVFAGHTWGEHFSDMRFLVAMIAIVFAFGLSFLGVWEIPIPGFVGSSTMTGAAQREGAVGAFSKGVLSTVLATPCAGPLIGPAVGWAVKQPPALTFGAFTFIGLGMAAPYLLIGAMPRLVNLLPKPGAWMDVFKQLMGFVLMATVIFLFLSVPDTYVVSTLVLLLGIAVACWLLGLTPMTAALNTKVLSWTSAMAIITLSAALGFVAMVPSHTIEWQPFSRVTLDQQLAKGNTVLVDFTANW